MKQADPLQSYSERHGVSDLVSFGPFSLSVNERLLTRDGRKIEIGGRSLDLLSVLTEQPGRVLSKRELIKRVWPDVVVEDGSLRFHMANLRKLLGDGEGGARYIATQVGVGYAFVAPVRKAGPPTARLPIGRTVELPRTASKLPARLPRLIGREHDLRLLQDRLVSAPMFTVVGPAGVGKTSLAIVLGHVLADQFEDGVAFVDLGMLEGPAFVLSTVAGELGIPIHGDDPLAAIVEHVRNRRFLLLLDNCEHVVDEVARLVERLMIEAPQVRILATSRESLRVRGEHIHRLDALKYPDNPAELSLEQLLTYPAIQLFCERAAAADSSFDLDEASARLIADMCHRLDGMALPIELAAVRVATHGASLTARQLGERLSFNWSGLRTAQPRQRTLQATLDWSFELLSDVERSVLERLSIFVGSFSIDAALEVVSDADLGADDVAAAIDAIATKSLIAVDRSHGADTFRLLEMTRAYARHRLLSSAAGELGPVARRHATFFLTELEAVAAQEVDLLDARHLNHQLGNIRGALDWSFGQGGDSRLGVRLAAASARVFMNTSHLIECRSWCARAIAEIDDGLRGTEAELELQGALGISLMFARGNFAEAGTALSRALEVATALDDHWNQLRILGLLHIFHKRIGEHSASAEYADMAMEVADRIDDDHALGIAHSLSGVSHHIRGNQKQALRDLKKALKLLPPSVRASTVRYGIDHRTRAAIMLARVLWLSGDPAEAVTVARQAVSSAAQLDHPASYCLAQIWALSISIWMDELDQAEEALVAFSECAKLNGLAPFVAAANGLRAVLDIHRGKATAGIARLEDSISLLNDSHLELQTMPLSIPLVRALLRDGRCVEATELLNAVIARCKASGELVEMPEMLRLKAEISRRCKAGADDPVTLLDNAFSMSRQQGAIAWEVRVTGDLAALVPQQN